MTDVLSSAWNHLKFFSRIFVPALRPLLEVLGVPLLQSHPGEMKE